ncbi:MAG: hypothetical protein ACRD9S_22310 [Pyrinomonadaceae bacterium]
MRIVKFNSLLLVFLAFATAVGQQKNIIVAGRAIDERGTPVSNAIATLYYPPCRGCIDQILPVGRSLSEGVFFVDYSAETFKGLKLYLQEEVPKGFWSPIDDPPFENVSHLSQFRGIPIRPRKGRTRVDLGNVLVKVRYARVIVELPSVLGEKYKPSREALTEVNLTLRDARGKIIYDGSLPELAFDPKSSFVNLALPKGEWRVDFSCNNRNRTLRSPLLSIDIQDLGCKRFALIDGKQTVRACN